MRGAPGAPALDANIVEKPIINDPYEEPTRYWHIPTPMARRRGEQKELREGRREAGYFLSPRTRKYGGEPLPTLFEEEFIPIELANRLRERVKAWRESGYPGATRVTKELLEYWGREGRDKRLFFCQIEAAETVIFLTEAPAGMRQGIEVPADEPTDVVGRERGYRVLRRYACKMATGSGKTVVMAMVAAWSVINKGANPRDGRFSDAVLVVCPNLTILERLQVLKPSAEGNYYEEFDLVPIGMRPLLNRGKFLVTNWHKLQSEEDSRKKRVTQRGPEGERAFCSRVLRELGGKRNLLVINDEAHHAYRPADMSEEERQKVRGEARTDLEEATVWVGGLDRINYARGINMCVDFSATPFYLGTKGHREGEPFPWVVSDFSLMDAIESGLVTIPQVPLRDDQGKPTPKYKYLWQHVYEALGPEERGTARKGPRPEAVYREAHGALMTIASDWKETLVEWRQEGRPVPPVLIVVCANTYLAQVFYEAIAGGEIVGDLANKEGRQVTVRIDTRAMDQLQGDETGSAAEEAQRLREIVATVGKEGKPGEQVRCVVSVGMLSEGWDAHNVTHILGIRAFTSQLLCEQVVGRGLRRTQYDDLAVPEYVKVYGVPFEVIPVQEERGEGKSGEREATLVYAMRDRRYLAITFPRVDGYIVDARWYVECDIESLAGLQVGPEKEPTRTTSADAVETRVDEDDREKVWQEWWVQSTLFRIAGDITRDLAGGKEDAARRAALFPQVLTIVRRYVREKVKKPVRVPWEEIKLKRYSSQIADILRSAIRPRTGHGGVRPVINRVRPTGSSVEVRFRTGRLVEPATKSHLNASVLDNIQWERMAVACFEQDDRVVSYVRNDHLDFEIPYYQHGIRHPFRPDFIVRLRTDAGTVISVVVEVKGYERDPDKLKQTAAERWVEAINNDGRYGRWAFIWCTDPNELAGQLDTLARS